MPINIHPSVFLRGSFVSISIFLIIAVFFAQPFLDRLSKSVQQVEQLPSEKEVSSIDQRNHKNVYTNCKIVIILITSNASLWRVPLLMKNWGNKFIQSKFSAGLYFEFIENQNKMFNNFKNIPFMQKYKNVIDSQKNKPNIKDIDVAIKEINALDYFVHNTEADWLFRGVDDTYVNMKEFPRFFASLPDPTNKSLLYGDCIEYPTPYLHGGSGILLSREMAKKLLNYSNEWLKKVEHPEEIYFSKLIENAGFNVTDFASPSFMGLFNDNNKNFHEIPKCKNKMISNSKRKCPHDISSIKKTIFFHDSNHKMTMDNWTSLVEDGPDNLNWIHGETQELFCF